MVETCIRRADGAAGRELAAVEVDAVVAGLEIHFAILVAAPSERQMDQAAGELDVKVPRSATVGSLTPSEEFPNGWALDDREQGPRRDLHGVVWALVVLRGWTQMQRIQGLKMLRLRFAIGSPT